MLAGDRMVEEIGAVAERKRKASTIDPELRERIVDAAMDLAEDVGWDNVRLGDVAGRLGIGLAEVAGQYRDLDAVANAWFGRARAAMLAPLPAESVRWTASERLETLMLRWFDALAPRRDVTAQMLAAKMWPFHPHHWVPMIFDLSRTILWLRDAAALDATPPRRQVEEVGLSALFLATLAVWARDDTAGQERTRRFLGRRLGAADRVMTRVFARRGRQSDED
jgi:AcrR family transcriptional regulator